MKTKEVYFIEGDGIGPEISKATRFVLDTSVKRTYNDRKLLEWIEVLAGEKAYQKTGEYLPRNTLDYLKNKAEVAIKGPLTTPVGSGFRSLNVTLRQTLDLYACVRPIKYFKGVESPVKRPELVDMVIFRENTEDVYAGIEWAANSPEAKKVLNFLEDEFNIQLRPDTGLGLKPVSETGSKRLISKAIQFALDNDRESVTLVHKGNIMKFTEGAFQNWGYELARNEFAGYCLTEDQTEERKKGQIVLKDRIADNMFQQVLTRPDEYSVIATTNLNGDYLSDALAAQVGGLGLAPGANMSDKLALFEPTHGTVPKRAGTDTANPCSMILSGAMLLDHIGWDEAAENVRSAVEKTILDKQVTGDLARMMEGSKTIGCTRFSELVVGNLEYY